MAKKKGVGNLRETEAERRAETHMDIFRRLAAVVNMHGTPGDRKPRGK